jgi:hypothetical protein
MDLQQEQLKYNTSNESYMQPNVLELRLDTNDLLDRIKNFLAGGRVIYTKDENNQPKIQFIEEGEPLANALGVQSISSWISMQLNPSTVQGNLKLDQYYSLLERTRKSLAKNLLVNSPRYEIKRADRGIIVEGILTMLELFISRTLDNKERDSYSQSLGARIGNFIPSPKKGLF